MGEPKNVKPGDSRVSDVIDSVGDGLPYTNDLGIVSTPETIIGTQGPDSPVCLGYGSVARGKLKSSVSPDSDAYSSPPKKLSKISEVDIGENFPMLQDKVMSSR